MPKTKAYRLLERIEAEYPDFCDPETEQCFIEMYNETHDALLALDGVRTVADEGLLAYARAVLMQRGLDESRLPWEISSSYNLRLAEHLERLARSQPPAPALP